MTTDARGASRFSQVALIVGLLIAPALGLVTAVRISAAEPSALAPPTKAILVEPTQRRVTGEATAKLEVTFDPAAVVLSRGASGTVTQVAAKPGQTRIRE